MGYIPAMEYVPFFRGNLAAIFKKHICAEDFESSDHCAGP